MFLTCTHWLVNRPVVRNYVLCKQVNSGHTCGRTMPVLFLVETPCRLEGSFFETLVSMCESTWRYEADEQYRHLNRRENIRTNMFKVI